MSDFRSFGKRPQSNEKISNGSFQEPQPSISPISDAQSPIRKKYGAVKTVIGFLIGFFGSFAILDSMLSDDCYNCHQDAHALGGLAMIAGLLTAALFKQVNFGELFWRISFGMNTRLPTAVFGSWFLAYVSYLLLRKHGFSGWYDEHVAEFWSSLIVPPSVGIAIMVIFRWASNKSA